MSLAEVLSKDKKTSMAMETDTRTFKNDYEALEKFVKQVEKLVRSDIRYDIYLAKLHEAGVMKCAILGELPEDVTIEMHHGPIFTLFTIVEIVCRYHMIRGDWVTTFSVADEVLEAHEDNMIQIVGLSKTPHKGWHMQKIFVHIIAAFGEVDRFIEKYEDGLSLPHIKEALRFIELCKKYKGSVDNDLFESSRRISFKHKK